MLFHGVYVLNKKPLIVALWGDDAWEVVANSSNKPDYFIWHNAWFQGTLGRMAKLKYKFFQLKQKGIVPLQMANSNYEERYRKLFGIPGFKCSSYVFTDEKQYPILNEEKKYDAVYAAQLKDFKRIPLAKDIKSLYVLTYKGGEKQWDLHIEYPEVNHADFNSSWIDSVEKNKLFSASKVGLCLSKEEGPMLASLEYMLNGLPVVSTNSKGGRDEYYSSDYCKVVKASSEKIKIAVESLIKQSISPAYIRNQTIQKLENDRIRYVNFLCDFIYEDRGIQLNRELLKNTIFNKPESNFMKLDEYKSFIAAY